MKGIIPESDFSIHPKGALCSLFGEDSMMLSGGAATSSAYSIGQSCRFNDDDSAYLSRTPRVAGNRRTWTQNFWIKRGNLGITSVIFDADEDANNRCGLYFNTSDQIVFYNRVASSTTDHLITTQVFRDPSAWMMITFAVDTTNATAGNRLRLYINGTEVTVFGTESNPSQNLEMCWNALNRHEIGGYAASSLADMYMSDYHNIDGAQLAASDFGETDTNGNWVPIEFAATNATLQPLDVTGLTTIGNMTSNGGLAALYDGDVTEAAAACARATTGPAYGGIDWGSGVTKSIVQANIWAPSDKDIGDSVENITIAFEGSTDNFSGSTVDLGVSTTGGAQATLKEISPTDTTAYRYHRVKYTGDGAYDTAELEFYTAGPVGYGTNGFHETFEDSSWFGKDTHATTSAPTLAFEEEYTINGTNASSFTASGAAVGTAANAHKVVVVVGGQGVGAGTVSGVTVGGNAMTKVDSTLESETECSIWYYDAAANELSATEDVVVTWSASKGNCGFAIYSIEGCNGSAFSVTSNANPGTGSLHTVANSATIAGMYCNGAGTLTNSWAASISTEDVDTNDAGEDVCFSTASEVHTTTTVGETVTCTPSSTTTHEAFVAVTFLATGDNSFEDSGLATNDQVTDSPTDDADNDVGNTCTWNPLETRFSEAGTHVYADGNLSYDKTVSGQGEVAGTIHLTSGKWFWEVTAASACYIGVSVNETQGLADLLSADGDGTKWMYRSSNGNKYKEGADGGAYGDTFTASDVISIALDLDNGILWFAKNGTWQNSATQGEIEAGTDTNAAYNDLTDAGGWRIRASVSMSAGAVILNCGQHAYTATKPAGFSSVKTCNLPAPTITDPSKYFQVDTFTGTGAELARTLTDASGAAVKPDLVWIKDRDGAIQHVLTDSARGATKELNADATAEETTVAQGLKSFDTSGYTLGTDGNYNTSSSPNVAWCWNTQGGAGSSNTDGTINTTTTSVGTTQEMSISTFTGNGTDPSSIGHGLGVTPEFLMVKGRSTSGAETWACWHKDLTDNTYKMSLDNAFAQAAGDVYWSNDDHTSTLVSLGSNSSVNKSGGTYVCYTWAGVEGFSKFGAYEGNGTNDNAFVNLGFRPAFIIIKSLDSTAGWLMFDNKREGYNVDNDALLADTTAAETTTDMIDMLSNGFKVRDTTLPGVAETYVYCAWAEFPFGGSGVSQARAR
jgi:hypothetical protein